MHNHKAKGHLTVIAFLLGAARMTAGQTCMDQTCLMDRGATGEINLGLIRGGMAVLDYDRDGFMDLVIADSPGSSNRLFHNEPDPLRPGGRTFVDATAGSGLDDADGVSRSSFAVAAADYDNDGDRDVFLGGIIGAASPNGLLYRNDGGYFTNVSQAAGIQSPCFHRAASWTDYNLDGWVDLFVVCNDSNDIDFVLHQNNGNATFTSQPGRLPLTRPALGISYAHLWTDFDDDGFDDAIVLSTLDPPILLNNVADPLGGRRLTDVAEAAGFLTLGPAPMGIAAGDYDNDGDFDFGVSDALVGTYYENVGGRLEQAFPFETDFSWGITWLDVDNDGDLDHYQCGAFGFTERFDSLIRNLGGGAWEDISPVLNSVSAQSQQSVQIDFNNDGRQDLITIHPGGAPQPISVLENISTTGNHWLGLHLRGDGTAINRDAIGAVVRVTAGGLTQVRQVQSGTSTTCTEDLRLHFGLGSAAVVDRIEVRWPTRGSLEERTDVIAGPIAADQIMTLSPQQAACCVCPAQPCVEASPGECRGLGGRRFAGASCSDIDCPADTPPAADPPEAIPGADPLNRYVGFIPGNPARMTAIRVTLESLYHPDPPDPPGMGGPDFSEYEGRWLWVGPPTPYMHAMIPPRTFFAARLQCTPHVMDWAAFEAVHVYGQEIVPSSRYAIQEVDVTCGGDVEQLSPSAPLVVTTARWGDVAEPFCPPSTREQPDFADVSVMIGAFRSTPGAAGKTQAQLVPALLDPKSLVNFSDISACVDAFRGQAYPLEGPNFLCPDGGR